MMLLVLVVGKGVNLCWLAGQETMNECWRQFCMSLKRVTMSTRQVERGACEKGVDLPATQ